MKGIILAGGGGKRLAPLALAVPKPLVPVNGRPLINYNLALFAKHGVNDVMVIVRPSDRALYAEWREACKKDLPSVHLTIAEEPEPMGTLGYSFHHLQDWMGDENVFVTNGDDIKNIDLVKMLAAHRAQHAAATLALMKVEKPDDYGVVLVDADYATAFLEKEPGREPGLVSAGMYIISRAALDHMAEGLPVVKKFLMFEKDMFPVLAAKRSLAAFVCEGTFYDCGTPERLALAARELA